MVVTGLHSSPVSCHDTLYKPWWELPYSNDLNISRRSTRHLSAYSKTHSKAQEHERAHQCELLQGWHTAPGFNDNSTVGTHAYRDWQYTERRVTRCGNRRCQKFWPRTVADEVIIIILCFQSRLLDFGSTS